MIWRKKEPRFLTDAEKRQKLTRDGFGSVSGWSEAKVAKVFSDVLEAERWAR